MRASLDHARWLLDHGCDGPNVLGTTGEATSFSAEDRVVPMAAAAAALDPARLMVGTGCPDLPTTLNLTHRAGALGFGAALVLPPYYYKGVSDAGIEAHFLRLVDGAVAEGPPIHLYNFPQMTGLTFSPELVARLMAATGGRIEGAKDSSGDLDLCSQTGRNPPACRSSRATRSRWPRPGLGGSPAAFRPAPMALAARRRGCGAIRAMPRPWPPAARPGRRSRPGR